MASVSVSLGEGSVAFIRFSEGGVASEPVGFPTFFTANTVSWLDLNCSVMTCWLFFFFFFLISKLTLYLLGRRNTQFDSSFGTHFYPKWLQIELSNLRIKALTPGPYNVNSAVQGFKHTTYWSVVQSPNRWNTLCSHAWVASQWETCC